MEAPRIEPEGASERMPHLKQLPLPVRSCGGFYVSTRPRAQGILRSVSNLLRVHVVPPFVEAMSTPVNSPSNLAAINRIFAVSISASLFLSVFPRSTSATFGQNSPKTLSGYVKVGEHGFYRIRGECFVGLRICLVE
jgi:hypothetical protein